MPTLSDKSRPKPSPRPATLLDRVAEAWGIERDFWDIWGEYHETPPEAEKGVLRSLGVDISSDPSLERALAERQWRNWSNPLPSTIVAGQRPPINIPVQIPQGLENSIATIEIRFESGISARYDIPLANAPTLEKARVRDRQFLRKQLRWPGEVCLGYHAISLKIGQQLNASGRLIIAPERAYEPEWLANRKAAAWV